MNKLRQPPNLKPHTNFSLSLSLSIQTATFCIDRISNIPLIERRTMQFAAWIFCFARVYSFIIEIGFCCCCPIGSWQILFCLFIGWLFAERECFVIMLITTRGRSCCLGNLVWRRDPQLNDQIDGKQQYLHYAVAELLVVRKWYGGKICKGIRWPRAHEASDITQIVWFCNRVRLYYFFSIAFGFVVVAKVNCQLDQIFLDSRGTFGALMRRKLIWSIVWFVCSFTACVCVSGSGWLDDLLWFYHYLH